MLTFLLLSGAAPEAVNPHGDPAGCGSCHELAGGQVGAARPVDATCRSCHPTADMHPVAVAPAEVRVEQGWPLVDGLLSCWTCHVEPAHGGEEGVVAPYHREGPYEPTTTLCYRCHERESFIRQNPHHPAQPRSPEDESCVACHRVNPDAGAPPEDSGLRGPAGAVCETCHEGEPHAGAVTHVGKAVPAGQALSPALPLDEGRVIACWTCHEVHDASPVAAAHRGNRRLLSAIRKLSGAVPEGKKAEPDPLLALPVNDASLCRACHGDGPQ